MAEVQQPEMRVAREQVGGQAGKLVARKEKIVISVVNSSKDEVLQ